MSDIPSTMPPADPDAAPWDDPPRRSPALSASAPVLVADGFEGPLDWLLEMVRAHKIDLAQISILALIESFAGTMDAALSQHVPTQGLARWAAWTVMVAQLAKLRSRLLLPPHLPEAREGHVEAEALRRQWINRTEMAAAADWLAKRPQLGRDVFARGQLEPVWVGQGVGRTEAAAIGDLTLGQDDLHNEAQEESDELTELLRACLVELRLPSHGELYRPRRLPFWSVHDATERIGWLLSQRPGGVSLEAFLPAGVGQGAEHPLHHRAALAETLVAGLEQADPWETILVT